MTVPKAVVAMSAAVDSAMSDLRWAGTLDDDERQWLLIEALCRELHPLGQVQVPSVQALRETVERQDRDEAIRREFDGRNYQALARKHRRSKRQIRRIIDRGRGH